MTNAERQRRYRAKQRRNVHFSSKSAEWSTPRDLFDQLDAEFGFTLDVAATAENAKCSTFFSWAEDGLAQPWTGVCWMNPPYGRQIGMWLAKAESASNGGAIVVALIPVRTDTKWWHGIVAKADEVRFLPGRLKFGGCKTSAPFPSAIVVWRSSP